MFLDLVRNFVAFTGDGDAAVKMVAKYHQYWAVTKAVRSTIEAVEGDGRAGVVWHTQGSGKSFEMAWYAGKVMRHPAMENPTLVVLTDRNDLDDQLFDETFAASRPGAPLPEAAGAGRVPRPPEGRCWTGGSRAASSSPRSRSSACPRTRRTPAPRSRRCRSAPTSW